MKLLKTKSQKLFSTRLVDSKTNPHIKILENIVGAPNIGIIVYEKSRLFRYKMTKKGITLKEL